MNSGSILSLVHREHCAITTTAPLTASCGAVVLVLGLAFIAIVDGDGGHASALVSFKQHIVQLELQVHVEVRNGVDALQQESVWCQPVWAVERWQRMCLCPCEAAHTHTS